MTTFNRGSAPMPSRARGTSEWSAAIAETPDGTYFDVPLSMIGETSGNPDVALRSTLYYPSTVAMPNRPHGARVATRMIGADGNIVRNRAECVAVRVYVETRKDAPRKTAR